MSLKVTSEDKDERKGEQKKASVLFVRIENNLRTTLKIMRMKVKKNYLQYLRHSTIRKEVGELSGQVFLNPM